MGLEGELIYVREMYYRAVSSGEDGEGCVASAEVVRNLARTAQVTGFDRSTARQSLSKDERRQELEAIRSEVGGGRRIVHIFDKDIYRDEENVLITGSFVQAMIDQILSREFPADLD